MQSDFYQILKEHMIRYPKMESRDFGKLIFQSEFGPEHLIDKDNKQTVLLYLQKERSELLQDSTPKLPENIGGGLCRFPLSACPLEKEAEALLAELFVLTAQEQRGRTEGILEKIRILAEFKIPGMDTWSRSWIEEGHPPVHHSDVYREAYHPHYRLLRNDYAGSFPVLLEISGFVKKGKPAIVGIDGRCGSGKTHLAKLINRLFSCNVIHMDDFYLPPAERQENWREVPGGNIDFMRLKSEVLTPLKRGKIINYRPYDCEKGKITKSLKMKPKALTIVEGSYSHHPSLKAQYDLKIFLTCSNAEKERRLRMREGDYYPVFEKQWIPMEENYFQYYEIEKSSNIKIDTSKFLCK